MSKELETFINDIRKAIKSIPSRPPITLKDANIVGIKLNSKSLEQLENEAHSQTLDINSPDYLMGIRIYKDELVNVPRYIVEGEIELNSNNQQKVTSILKEKKVDLFSLHYSSNVNDYNSHFNNKLYWLTEEEYNSIGEWLNGKSN